MLSFLQYLIAFVIAEWGATPAGQEPAAPDVAGIALLFAAFTAAAAIAGAWLVRGVQERRPQTARALIAAPGLGRMATLATFYVMAQPLNAREIPHVLGLAEWVLPAAVVRVAPFFALGLVAKAALHRALRAMGVGAPTLWASIKADARNAGLLALPLVAVLLIWTVLGVVAAAAPDSLFAASIELVLRLELASTCLLLGMMFVCLLGLPFALRLMWGCYRLPEGPFRERLEAYATRVGLQYREILVWPTGGEMLNAMVVGLLPRFRYVIFTDAILRSMGQDELEAVFAHEAGHARRGHMLLYFGFTCAIVLSHLLPGALYLVESTPLARLDPLWRTVLGLLVWLGVIFGWLSRRFEQEADVYGLETLEPGVLPPGADHPFARALDAIAEQGGVIREMTGWRHFSIADRIRFVRDYVADEGVRRAYRRSIARLRGGLIAVVVLFFALAMARVPGEVARAQALWDGLRNPGSRLLLDLAAANSAGDARSRAAFLARAAGLARRAGKDETALLWLREAVATAPDEPELMAVYAELLEGSGRPRGALLAWRDAAASERAGSTLRERAERHAEALERRLRTE